MTDLCNKWLWLSYNYPLQPLQLSVVSAPVMAGNTIVTFSGNWHLRLHLSFIQHRARNSGMFVYFSFIQQHAGWPSTISRKKFDRSQQLAQCAVINCWRKSFLENINHSSFPNSLHNNITSEFLRHVLSPGVYKHSVQCWLLLLWWMFPTMTDFLMIAMSVVINVLNTVPLFLERGQATVY